MLMKDKKGGIGKVIIWIIVILFIIGLIVLMFGYLGSDEEVSNQNEGTQGQNSGTQENNVIVDNSDLEEKPPRPPE